jgi:hypothetical protein
MASHGQNTKKDKGLREAKAGWLKDGTKTAFDPL